MANEYTVNAADLTSVANAIREKGGTSAQLVFPSGFVSAISGISTGVTVQSKTGTVEVSGSDTTVNCGFKPDAVFFITSNPHDPNNTWHAGVEFSVSGKTMVYTEVVPPSTSYITSLYKVTQTSSGFAVSGNKLSMSMDAITESNRSVDYIAIKYSA